MRAWIRDRALGLFFLGLFLTSWIGQLFTQAAQFIDEERDHAGERLASVWSAMADSDFWEAFWSSTLENWQSEFLQLGSFVIAAAYFVYKGSAESRDGNDRMEAVIEAIAEKVGVSVEEIHQGRAGRAEAVTPA